MPHPPQDQPSPWSKLPIRSAPQLPNAVQSRHFVEAQQITFQDSRAPEAKRKDPSEGWLGCHWTDSANAADEDSIAAFIASHRAYAITKRQHRHIYIFRGPEGQRRAVIWHRLADQPSLTIEDETC